MSGRRAGPVGWLNRRAVLVGLAATLVLGIGGTAVGSVCVDAIICPDSYGGYCGCGEPLPPPPPPAEPQPPPPPPPSPPPSGDTTSPTLSVTGPLKDREGKGLYATSYSLRAEATDASGVRSIEIQVDGVRRDYVSQTCVCALLRDFAFVTDSYTDGSRTIGVVATDHAGNVTSRAWQVIVDRRGDVYYAEVFDQAPALGAAPASREWLRLGTYNARVETSHSISTRATAACTRWGSCDVYRSRTLMSAEDAAATESYTIYTGPANDPLLPQITTLLEPRELDPADGVAVTERRGPISEGVDSWQTLPPNHGSEYVLRESRDSESGVITRRWIDVGTQLPLRAIAFNSVGAPVASSYWSYKPNRFELSELPAEHFSVPRPANATHEKTVEYVPNSYLGGVTDLETGLAFSPYYLRDTATGTTPDGTALDLCLRDLAIVKQTYAASIEEAAGATPTEDIAPDPVGPETYFLANYIETPGFVGCQPGRRDITTDASVVVASLADASSMAAADRAAYVDPALTAEQSATVSGESTSKESGTEAVVIEGQSETAYVVGVSEGQSSALVRSGATELTITGPFDMTTLDGLTEEVLVR
jgi:hypothetical protein